MNFFNKLCSIAPSFKMSKVILFCVLMLSANTVFSQSDLMQEDTNIGEEEYDTGFGLAGAPAKSWVVAKHIHGLWSITAVDAVGVDVLSGGLTISNLSVNLEGMTIGTFQVTSKWGYGSGLGGEATVGISCFMSVAFSGFPPLNGSYTRSHTYRIR